MAKDSRYFKHDTNARHDPKIKSLINKTGIKGYGCYWIVIEMLRDSSGYKLEDKSFNWEILAEETKMTIDEARQFIKDCVDRELLVMDDGFFYSMSLISRMQDLDEMRRRNSVAGKASAKVRWGSDD